VSAPTVAHELPGGLVLIDHGQRAAAATPRFELRASSGPAVAVLHISTDCALDLLERLDEALD
jgi:hypothetical protein